MCKGLYGLEFRCGCVPYIKVQQVLDKLHGIATCSSKKFVTSMVQLQGWYSKSIMPMIDG